MRAETSGPQEQLFTSLKPASEQRQPGGKWAPAHLIISYLSSSLQVSKVNIRYEENGLGIQVSHCFEEGDITLFL